MIQNNLKFGKVIKQGKTVSRYVVQDKIGLYLIALLFNGNLIILHKINRYKKFLENVNVYNNKGRIKLPNIKLFDFSVKPTLQDSWLAGFTDAEGSFGLYIYKKAKSGWSISLVFQISLHEKDKKILEAIAYFLHHNVPLSPPYKNLCIPKKPNCIIKNNTNAFQLFITDKDVLFQYIYPFFRNLSFYSRKGIDFSIWSLVLYIFIYVYRNLPNGREILLNLSKNINSKRYLSDLSDFI